MTPEQREQAVHEVRKGIAGGYAEIAQLFSLELTDGADAPFGDPQTLTAKQMADVVDRAQYQAMLSVANAETDSGAYDDACMYASVLIERGVELARELGDRDAEAIVRRNGSWISFAAFSMGVYGVHRKRAVCRTTTKTWPYILSFAVYKVATGSRCIRLFRSSPKL